MKKLLLFLFISFLFLSSCESYVTDIDKLNNVVKDEELNSEEEIEFLTIGLKTQFARTQGQLFIQSDALSDLFIFDRNNNHATFPTFEEIDKGDIKLQNVSLEAVFNHLGQLRYQADDLVRRLNTISIEEESKKKSALFNGYLYGGIARYFYASYFGLSENVGGGVIDNGPFIPSADMYDLAVGMFELALEETSDPYEIRLINSLIARSYLYKGDLSIASSFADSGLIQGDKPLQSLHNFQDGNYYWQQAYRRVQYAVSATFMEYFNSDSLESVRIPTSELPPVEKIIETDEGSDTLTLIFNYQTKYPSADSPISTITWQENHLMLAELSLHGFGAGDAMQLVNEVRSSHGLQTLDFVDLDVLFDERGKELFCTGSRLIDQRRFNKWHLSNDKWKYLPITQSERNGNPHIN